MRTDPDHYAAVAAELLSGFRSDRYWAASPAAVRETRMAIVARRLSHTIGRGITLLVSSAYRGQYQL